MSRLPRNLLLLLVCLVALVCLTSAFLITRASVHKIAPTQDPVPAAAASNKRPRNLFLQPEALRVSRRVGKRFGPSSRTASVLTGTVTVGGNVQPVIITRRQAENGESVELLVAGRALTWRPEEGAKVVSSTPTETERLLIERLVYDSADYFVLAQLRGANYFTVARNLRPDNAPDNYDGPLWTVVRVDDPPDQPMAALSKWRLYYLNSATGLIDKVVSEVQGERIETTFSDWTERDGEKFPSAITWTTQGQTLMTFNFTNVSFVAE